MKRSTKPTEHQEQVAVFDWAMAQKQRWPQLELMYAIPNQGKYRDTGRFYMAKEGLKAGVPDICLPVPSRGYCALYIEMKRLGGRVTERQEWYLEALAEHGNYTKICYDADAAIQTISWYLGDGL